MEYFNDERNIIYIKEENCLNNINVKEEVDYEANDNEEEVCFEKDKIIKMEEYDKIEDEPEINKNIESGWEDNDIKKISCSDNVYEGADRKGINLHHDVNIKQEELNFKEYEVERISIKNYEKNVSSSFKSENISQIGNYPMQLKSSNNIAYSSDLTIRQESFPLNDNSYEYCDGSVSEGQNIETNVESFKPIENSQASTSKSGLKGDNKFDLANENSTKIQDRVSTALKETQLQMHKTKNGKEAFSPKKLRDHSRIDTVEKPYKCSYCDYRTSQKSSLAIHIRIHTGEKPFKCNYCDYCAAQKSVLNAHIRTHTGEKPFKCNFCDFCAAQKSVLNTHVRIHTGEKPYSCNHCDYRSSDRSSLRSHVTTHSGLKPFKCSDCDYSSSCNSKLKRHIRIHISERPFKCNHCDYCASDKSLLRSHVRIHSEKLFKCSDCDYSALCNSKLKRHIRIHTGERPFKCNDCDYTATRKEHLQGHFKSHAASRRKLLMAFPGEIAQLPSSFLL